MATSGAGLLAGCGLMPPDPVAFDPRAVQFEERQQAGQLQPRPLEALSAQPTPSSRPGAYGAAYTRPATRPVPPGSATTQPIVDPLLGLTRPGVPAAAPVSVRLSLQEIVHRVVINNRDVRVAGFDAAVDETRITEAEARFDPSFITNLNYQRSSILTPAQSGGSGINVTDPAVYDTYQIQSGFKQYLPAGGQAQITAETQEINPKGSAAVTGPDPYWLNDITLQVTQPLLRDFGYAENQARVTIARNTQRVTQLEFRKQLEDTLEQTEKTYWQLYQAEQNLRIQQELLEQTNDMVNLLGKRVGQDVSRVQVSQANATLASRKAQLRTAEQAVADASDQLKRFMEDDAYPIAGGTLILPASPPLLEPVDFDLGDEIAAALDNRFDLGEQLIRIDSADTAALVAKNNTLPQVNLQGSYALQGVGSSWDGAFRKQGDDLFDQWSVGLQIEIPLGNREALAIWTRSQLQRLQAIDSYRALVDTASMEVKQAARDVVTRWQELDATRAARAEAEDSLNAINQRIAASEPLTPEFVQLKLDRQQALADSAQQEAAATAGYNVAISHLERVKGTLLRYDNVQMAEDIRPLGSSSFMTNQKHYMPHFGNGTDTLDHNAPPHWPWEEQN